MSPREIISNGQMNMWYVFHQMSISFSDHRTLKLLEEKSNPTNKNNKKILYSNPEE